MLDFQAFFHALLMQMFLTTELRDVAEKKSNWDSTETRNYYERQKIMKDERQDRDERDEQTHGNTHDIRYTM